MAVFMFFGADFLRSGFWDVAYNVIGKKIKRENSIEKICILGMKWKLKFEKLLMFRTDNASSKINSFYLLIFDSFWLRDCIQLEMAV